jgi:putative transposase
MPLIDEFTRECLATRVARRINSFGVLETMADVILMQSVLSTSNPTMALR